MIMGRDVAHFLKGCKNYIPGRRRTDEYAQKHRLDTLEFACAVHDFARGKWMTSESRDPRCDMKPDECRWNQTTGEVGSYVRPPRKKKKQRNGRNERKSAHYTAKVAGVNMCEIMTEQGGRCYACGIDLIKSADYELDHIMPLSMGGTNEYCNLQFLCRNCNRTKSDALPLVWAASRGIKLPAKFIQKYCK